MKSATRILNSVVALALLAAISALIWFAVLAPLQDWRSAALSKRPQAVAEIRQLQTRISGLEDERDQLSGNEELNILWRAAQTGVATARIQSQLSKLASERGISLRSISPTRARDLTLAQAAGFRLEMESSLDQLVSFLQAVEYHSPALLVEKASLRRLNKPNTDQPQPLVFAQIDISAPVVLDAEVNQ
ncbi:type II secretion system protein GspM [Sulfitobacter sp. HNIBRBA2951]|uniref:type II secretion system protein GspM n=1 Tax=Sulfitobacter aquimarinus TaxID=3158557 RepID=UPI0032E00154